MGVRLAEHYSKVGPAISNCPRKGGGDIGASSVLQSDFSKKLPAVQLGTDTWKNEVIAQVLLGTVSLDPLEATLNISFQPASSDKHTAQFLFNMNGNFVSLLKNVNRNGCRAAH